MSDTEDYPGPTHDHPEKQGQNPGGRADEEMVKPPAKPLPDVEKRESSSTGITVRRIRDSVRRNGDVSEAVVA